MALAIPPPWWQKSWKKSIFFWTTSLRCAIVQFDLWWYWVTRWSQLDDARYSRNLSLRPTGAGESAGTSHPALSQAPHFLQNHAVFWHQIVQYMYIDYFANAVGQGQLSELKRAWNMGPGRVVEWGLGGCGGGAVQMDRSQTLSGLDSCWAYQKVILTAIQTPHWSRIISSMMHWS